MDNKFFDFPAELKAQESGYFEGYASTFGGEPDSVGDVIVKGAFVNTLINGGYGGRGIKMLWQHDNRNPIGRWEEIIEDDKGLKVKGQLAVKSTQGKDAYELMKIGAIDGLSIGYDTVESVVANEGRIKRYLKQVDLWEISPVTFAANPRANITQVKAAIESATNERELEQALRDGGLTIRAAQYIVSQCKHVLLSDSTRRKNGKREEDLQTLKRPEDDRQSSQERTSCIEKSAKEKIMNSLVKAIKDANSKMK